MRAAIFAEEVFPLLPESLHPARVHDALDPTGHSMKILTVQHATTYRYSEPVQFGEHRLMIRPRDSHDLRLLRSELTLSPPATVRWLHDVFGNSVALAQFADPAPELKVVSILTLERYALNRPAFPVAPEAATYPFVYSNNDRTDLGRLLEQHHPDPKGGLAEWAQQFVPEKGVDTVGVLATMNAAIKRNFTYAAREAEGVQSPLETLERGSGSCRDFALLLIEAVRCLGFGARFVSGYLYDPVLDGPPRTRCRAPVPPTPGPKSICRAPAGSNTTRPMAWSPART